MIDTNFIVQYTNGLYSTPAEHAPRYDEFRDMFSSGQLASKEWVIKELINLGIIKHQSIVIVGAWFGTLGLLIKRCFLNTKITLLDIDPRCKIFLDNITYDNNDITPVTNDMYQHEYTEDVVVNTSCEHIDDIHSWLQLLKKDTLVILQSNDYSELPEHINCVLSIDEFKKQTMLSDILYAGELKMPMYTRYMIIGRT